jgi:hypothetical protein
MEAEAIVGATFETAAAITAEVAEEVLPSVPATLVTVMVTVMVFVRSPVTGVYVELVPITLVPFDQEYVVVGEGVPVTAPETAVNTEPTWAVPVIEADVIVGATFEKAAAMTEAVADEVLLSDPATFVTVIVTVMVLPMSPATGV